jgi:hypothetical protein
MTRSKQSSDATAVRSVYFLAEHAYCCEFDDGAIILELRTGTYVGVHAQYLPNMRARVHNWPESLHSVQAGATSADADSEAAIADLLARGILTNLATPKHSRAAPAPRFGLTPTAAMCASKLAPPLAICRFSAAFLRSILWHGDSRLESLLNWMQLKQRSIYRDPVPSGSDRLLLTVMYFLRLRLWLYTADQHCLFDSLVLAVYLTNQAIACTLIIGVSTKPFTAHAWVQIGELVLNDTAEHVQTFTPILVVGASA